MLKMKETRWSNLVTKIREWKAEDTVLTREGNWFSCVGVPLHCWTKHTFEKIGNFWGKVLEVDIGVNFDQALIRLEIDKEYGDGLEQMNIANRPLNRENEGTNRRKVYEKDDGTEGTRGRRTYPEGTTPPATYQTATKAAEDSEEPNDHHGLNVVTPRIPKLAHAKGKEKRQWEKVALGERWNTSNEHVELTGASSKMEELSPFGPKSFDKMMEQDTSQRPKIDDIREKRDLELEWAIENDFFGIEKLLAQSWKEARNQSPQQEGTYQNTNEVTQWKLPALNPDSQQEGIAIGGNKERGEAVEQVEDMTSDSQVDVAVLQRGWKEADMDEAKVLTTSGVNQLRNPIVDEGITSMEVGGATEQERRNSGDVDVSGTWREVLETTENMNLGLKIIDQNKQNVMNESGSPGNENGDRNQTKRAIYEINGTQWSEESVQGKDTNCTRVSMP